MPPKYTNESEFNIIEPKNATGGVIEIATLGTPAHKRGELHIYIEIEASDRDNEEIIKTLVKELEKQYYSAPTDSIEYAFENALSKANIAIKDILLAKPKNWLSQIHALVAAVSEGEIHISNVGSVHAFLARPTRIDDVLEGNNPKGRPQHKHPVPNPVKFFSNIVSGKLDPGNSIVLTNEAVLDYLSPERIRKTALESTAQESILLLTELLEKAAGRQPFGFGIIKRSEAKVVEVVKKKQAKAMITKPVDVKPESKVEPIELETEKTDNSEAYQAAASAPKDLAERKGLVEKYLAPIGAGTFSAAKSKVFKEYLKEVTDTIKEYAPVVANWGLNILSRGLELAQKGANKLLPLALQLPKIAKSLLKNKAARTYHIRRAKETLNSAWHKTLDKTKSLPMKQKIVLASAAGLIIVFAASITQRANENVNAEKLAQYQSAVAAIEEKRDQAQAALIYKKEERSRILINEGRTLLAALPRENEDQAQKFQNLTNDLDTLLAKAEKKEIYGNLELVANIIPPLAPSDNAQLTLAGDNLVYTNGAQAKLAKVDIANGLILTLPFVGGNLENFTHALALNNRTVSLLAAEIVMVADTTTETLTTEKFAGFPDDTPIAAYSRNLYAVDKAKNTIVRLSKSNPGFSPAANWLTQSYDVSDISDIAVDGYIYLLDEQGNIHAFLRGKFDSLINWPLPHDLPGNKLQLYTTENLDEFYILDPSKERIVRITKAGKLVNQLVSPDLLGARSFVIMDDGRTAYVLLESKIVKIGIR